ncbi:hypothetical protein GQ457_05G018860 [Hibiscus cannabinus]
MQQYCGVVLKQLRSERPRKHRSRMSAQPKRIKDYLECKINQRRFRPNIINRPMISNEKERRIERKNIVFITSRYVLNLPPGED